MMDKEAIEVDNRLVAKFMGYSFSQEYESFNDFDFTWEKENDGIWHKNVDEDQDVGYVKINGIVPKDYEYFLKYHKSWDWLMPVVEKIESLGFWTKIGAHTSFDNKYKSFDIKKIKPKSDGEYIYNYEGDWNESKIDAVYCGVVEFIKWYNDNI